MEIKSCETYGWTETSCANTEGCGTEIGEVDEK